MSGGRLASQLVLQFGLTMDDHTGRKREVDRVAERETRAARAGVAA